MLWPSLRCIFNLVELFPNSLTRHKSLGTANLRKLIKRLQRIRSLKLRKVENIDLPGNKGPKMSSSSSSVASHLDSRGIIEEGDLEIMVLSHDENITWTVSSQAMSLASPVWHKYITPPFHRLGEKSKEKNGSGTIDPLDLTEDDPQALRILLNITHLQYRDVPVKVSDDVLYQIAVLCDKYDCVGLIQPWFTSWTASASAKIPNNKLGEWLFVAWAFGMSDVFQSVARRLINDIIIDEEDRALTAADKPILEPMPPDIIGSTSLDFS